MMHYTCYVNLILILEQCFFYLFSFVIQLVAMVTNVRLITVRCTESEVIELGQCTLGLFVYTITVKKTCFEKLWPGGIL